MDSSSRTNYSNDIRTFYQKHIDKANNLEYSRKTTRLTRIRESIQTDFTPKVNNLTALQAKRDSYSNKIREINQVIFYSRPYHNSDKPCSPETERNIQEKLIPELNENRSALEEVSKEIALKILTPDEIASILSQLLKEVDKASFHLIDQFYKSEKDLNDRIQKDLEVIKCENTPTELVELRAQLDELMKIKRDLDVKLTDYLNKIKNKEEIPSELSNIFASHQNLKVGAQIGKLKRNIRYIEGLLNLRNHVSVDKIIEFLSKYQSFTAIDDNEDLYG